MRRRRMAKAVDPVRDLVRASVQEHLRKFGEAAPLMPLPEGVENVEVQTVDAANTVIRFKMKLGGPRYFNVKVSEQW